MISIKDVTINICSEYAVSYLISNFIIPCARIYFMNTVKVCIICLKDKQFRLTTVFVWRNFLILISTPPYSIKT